ncbi:MAG: hypothetical protein Q4A28_05145 [Brachymonas sp.]|nr:hypothetical protein [Brachymonas sp.]
MRKIQNTLHNTAQGNYQEQETLVEKQERKKVAQLPVHAIGHIFCFGNVLVSPFFDGVLRRRFSQPSGCCSGVCVIIASMRR